MRVIAVANQKGGCGKTTVSINLAACFARDGQRTLLIDLDPQGHCALGLSVPEEQIQYHTGDVLLGRSGVSLDRIVWQISSSFDLAPSKLELSDVEGKLASADDRLSRLRDAMRSISGRYDVVVIDTPPTVGLLTSNALLASTDVLVPVDTGYFALHGLSKQLETMERIYKRTGHRPALRILGNLYDVRTKLAREILAELRRRHRDSMTTTFINFNTKLKESTSFGQPITEYDPASSGCRDFMRLARELLAAQPGGQELAPPAAQQAAQPATQQFGRAAARPAAAAEASPTVMQRVEDLAIKANALLATAKPLFGPNSARIDDQVFAEEERAPSDERIAAKEPGAVEAAVGSTADEWPLDARSSVGALQAASQGGMIEGALNAAGATHAAAAIGSAGAVGAASAAGSAGASSAAFAGGAAEPYGAAPAAHGVMDATLHAAAPRAADVQHAERPLAGVWRPAATDTFIAHMPAPEPPAPLARTPIGAAVLSAFAGSPAPQQAALQQPALQQPALQQPAFRGEAFSQRGDRAETVASRGDRGEAFALRGEPQFDSASQPAPAGWGAVRGEVDHHAIQRRIDDIYGVHPVPHGMRFVINAPSATTVRLAGDFNGWSPSTTPLVSNGEPSVFAVTLPLAPGRYQYRYVIDGEWRNDPHNAIVERNPFGELNNVVEVA